MSLFLCQLPSRAVVRIGGAEAASFLHNLVTCDVAGQQPGEVRYGALLTPQGKILFDFLLHHAGDAYFAELPAAHAADFVKRMSLYKLRAQVEIADVSSDHRVWALWGAGAATALPPSGFGRDPRHPDLGARAVLSAEAPPHIEQAQTVEAETWHAHRIALGIPEGGLDFEYGQAFPHDADMDDLAGVAFEKGCFVGQEVVARMKHRGTARRRIVQVAGDGALPPAGSEITADGKPVGAMGSSTGAEGLALVRIDRVGAALRDGTPLLAEGVALTPSLPAWARFDWPAGAEGDGESGD